MARALHLLICISAAMTATGYKYSYNFEPRHMPYNFRNTDSVDYPSHDRMNARSDEGRTRITERSIVRPEMRNPQHTISDSGDHAPRSYKIMNRAPKPIAISQRIAGSADNSVLYPGPITSRQGSEIKNLPENCTALKLCEDVPGYPVDRANTLIAELREAGKIDYLAMDKLEMLPGVTLRYGLDNKELCESQIKISYPQAGLDKYNHTHTVLNTKQHRIQGVQVEICMESSKPLTCTSELHILCTQNCYESQCVQKFTYRHFLTIDKKYVPLAVPSSCACMAKKKPAR